MSSFPSLALNVLEVRWDPTRKEAVFVEKGSFDMQFTKEYSLMGLRLDPFQVKPGTHSVIACRSTEAQGLWDFVLTCIESFILWRIQWFLELWQERNKLEGSF